MSNNKFVYSGKFVTEFILLLIGIGLAISIGYDLLLTESTLIFRTVELPPLLSKIIMFVLLVTAIGLAIVSVGNLKNRNTKFIELAQSHMLIPKRFTKGSTRVDFASVENIERQDQNGIELIVFKVKDAFGNISLESTKFESASEYSRFLGCLEEAIS